MPIAKNKPRRSWDEIRRNHKPLVYCVVECGTGRVLDISLSDSWSLNSLTAYAADLGYRCFRFVCGDTAAFVGFGEGKDYNVKTVFDDEGEREMRLFEVKVSHERQ